jgi:hypothetical protein
LGFTLLFGCSSPPQQSMMRINSLTSQSGEEAAAGMRLRYSDTRPYCRDVEEMAFKCTGVIFRGTVASPAFHAWNPAPTAYQRNGVSFSFLRRDSKFTRLPYDYNHGFIFYPENDRPAGKDTVEVRCVFPLDGWTNERGNDACGPDPANPVVSRPCQVQGVNTAQQWFAHFTGPAGSVFRRQCGFKVHEALGMAAAVAFDEAIKAMGLLGTQSFNSVNELVYTPWAQDVGERLPIQAFFYTGTGGLSGAQEDQKDFYEQTGILLPVIRMTLPANASVDANFEYIGNDQWAPAN